MERLTAASIGLASVSGLVIALALHGVAPVALVCVTALGLAQTVLLVLPGPTEASGQQGNQSPDLTYLRTNLSELQTAVTRLETTTDKRLLDLEATKAQMALKHQLETM